MHKHFRHGKGTSNEINVTYYIVSHMDLATESIFCTNHRDVALLDCMVLHVLFIRKTKLAHWGFQLGGGCFSGFANAIMVQFCWV